MPPIASLEALDQAKFTVSFLQIAARFPFVLQRCHLVGIDANHKVIDMVINPREPVSCTGRNNNDVAGLELIALSIANRRGIIAWSIDERPPDVAFCR